MRIKLNLFVLLAFFWTTLVVAADDPQQVVKNTANKVLAEVTLNKTGKCEGSI